jgi:hypothetical protein
MHHIISIVPLILVSSSPLDPHYFIASCLASPVHMTSENADSWPVSSIYMLSEDKDCSTGSFVSTLPEDKDKASGETDGDCGGSEITCGCKQPRDDEEEFLKQILDLQMKCDEGENKIQVL